MATSKRTLDVQIRMLREEDLPAILAIENLEFAHPWTDPEFRRCLRVPYCVGRVAEYSGEVIGYSVHLFHRFRLDLLTIAVSGGFQLRGVGRKLMEHVTNGLEGDRAFVFATVRERNLDAQLFLQRLGFVANAELLHGMYRETAEDALQFWYTDGDAEPRGQLRSHYRVMSRPVG